MAYYKCENMLVPSYLLVLSVQHTICIYFFEHKHTVLGLTSLLISLLLCKRMQAYTEKIEKIYDRLANSKLNQAYTETLLFVSGTFCKN